MAIPAEDLTGLSAPPAAAGYSKVDVEVTRLSDVHKSLMAEYESNFLPRWERIKSELRDSQFGFSEQFEEASYVAHRHKAMMDDARQFGDLLRLGLQALAGAARYMADEYEGADSLSAGAITQAQADRAFNPEPGQRSVQDIPGNGALVPPPPPPPPTAAGAHRPI